MGVKANEQGLYTVSSAAMPISYGLEAAAPVPPFGGTEQYGLPNGSPSQHKIIC